MQQVGGHARSIRQVTPRLKAMAAARSRADSGLLTVGRRRCRRHRRSDPAARFLGRPLRNRRPHRTARQLGAVSEVAVSRHHPARYTHCSLPGRISGVLSDHECRGGRCSFARKSSDVGMKRPSTRSPCSRTAIPAACNLTGSAFASGGPDHDGIADTRCPPYPGRPGGTVDQLRASAVAVFRNCPSAYSRKHGAPVERSRMLTLLLLSGVVTDVAWRQAATCHCRLPSEAAPRRLRFSISAC